MRTTVTLDEDVQKLLRHTMRERGLSFKAALNTAIRTGLSSPKPKARKPFVQKTFSLGTRENFQWDKALSLAEVVEDEELIRKMSLRK